jgi:hypothetical protein
VERSWPSQRGSSTATVAARIDSRSMAKAMCAKIRDAAMAVLKVERVQELFGFLVVDLGQRLAHGERRTRILGHAVRLHLGIGAVNRVHLGAGLVVGGKFAVIRVWFVTE